MKTNKACISVFWAHLSRPLLSIFQLFTRKKGRFFKTKELQRSLQFKRPTPFTNCPLAVPMATPLLQENTAQAVQLVSKWVWTPRKPTPNLHFKSQPFKIPTCLHVWQKILNTSSDYYTFAGSHDFKKGRDHGSRRLRTEFKSVGNQAVSVINQLGFLCVPQSHNQWDFLSSLLIRLLWGRRKYSLRRGLSHSRWKHIYECYQRETLLTWLIKTLTPCHTQS